MCGIAGFYNLDDEPAAEPRIRKMTEALAHRGPDGEGVHVDGPVALGHRRLAILDLSPAGRQPMSTPDGRFVITYNGEVYNFRELRARLKARGHSFRSQSDTEVVLHAFEEWGEKCVERFNGMFALAIWDRRRRELFLARDRYGIKPLYYTWRGDTFFFASEIKGLFAHPECGAEIDPAALVEYFTFQNMFGDRTLYRDVKLLPAGTYLYVTPSSARSVGGITPRCWWDFDFREPERRVDVDECREELLRLFRQAVQSQLVSDVEVGAYLSGGMDSGSIVAVASRESALLRTFTCGFDLLSASDDERSFDERNAATRMAAMFDTEHHESVLRPADMQRAIPDVAWYLDEPRVGQSYPNYYAARLASRFVKVVLSGTGGDELFGGYPWRYYPHVASATIREFQDSYYRQWVRLIPESRRRQIFAPIGKEARQVDTRAIFDEVFTSRIARMAQTGKTLRPEDCVNYCLYFEAKTFLHGLLVVEDKLSMAHGLETRVPFLDNDLVDFAMRLPARFKLGRLPDVTALLKTGTGLSAANAVPQLDQFIRNPRDGKLLLRQAMSRLLPDEITMAGKQGFSAPDAAWFRNESREYVRQTLVGSTSRISDFLDREAICDMLDEHESGQQNRRLLVWSLLNVEFCLRQFSESRRFESIRRPQFAA